MRKLGIVKDVEQNSNFFEVQPPSKCFMIIPTGTSKIFANPEDIVFMQGDDNYTHINFNDNTSILSSKTLKEFEILLDQKGFIRCHKSFLFNLGYIKEYSSSRSEIRLISGELLPVGRKYITVLHNLFEEGMIVIP